MSHQCMSQSPAPSSACLTPCPVVLQGPHLSALNSIETYSCPWMWMSMHSRPAKCIQALGYLSPANLSFWHYSHFHPSLRAINIAAWSSSSSVCIHTKHMRTHKQAQTCSLENTHTEGSVLSVSPVWFIDGRCKGLPQWRPLSCRQAHLQTSISKAGGRGGHPQWGAPGVSRIPLRLSQPFTRDSDNKQRLLIIVSPWLSVSLLAVENKSKGPL